jgi:RNase P/RNase MRP subunit p30
MYDFNLKVRSTSNDVVKKQLLTRLLAFGWTTVCWSQSFVGNATNAKTTLKPSSIVDIGKYVNEEEFRVLYNLSSNSSSSSSSLRQLTRVSLIIDEIKDAHVLHGTNQLLSQFDLVSVCPGNIAVFTYLCKTADIDIISLDFTHKLPFNLNKKLLDEAVQRGICFEILYTPIISSSSQVRCEVFANTHVLIQYLRGRNIIISSGADNYLQIRCPLDVCGIAQVLGISKSDAVKCIQETSGKLIQRAAQKKTQNMPTQLLSLPELYSRYPEIKQSISQSSFLSMSLDEYFCKNWDTILTQEEMNQPNDTQQNSSSSADILNDKVYDKNNDTHLQDDFIRFDDSRESIILDDLKDPGHDADEAAKSNNDNNSNSNQDVSDDFDINAVDQNTNIEISQNDHSNNLKRFRSLDTKKKMSKSFKKGRISLYSSKKLKL